MWQGLEEFVAELQAKLQAGVAGMGGGDSSSVEKLTEVDEELVDIGEKVLEAMKEAESNTAKKLAQDTEEASKSDKDVSGESGSGGKTAKELLKDFREKYFVQEGDDDETKRSKRSKQTEVIASGVNKLADTGMSLMKESFSTLESIYERIKAASPLLQTIESLFNLAMTLFIMPLGNKLAEEVLPAVIDLVDAVVDMWDNMEDMTLSEMIEYMMDAGVSAFAQFFNDIGDTLEEQGGLLGSVGTLMNTIADSLTNGTLVSLINAGFSVMSFMLDNVKEIISLFVAFKALWLTLKITELFIEAEASTPIIGTVLATGTAASAVAGLAVYGVMSNAEGGYVPATEGGQLRIVGEGGEGEYIIPESKMNSAGVGGVTNNFYISGLTYDDLVDTIDERVSRSISRSRVQGAFRWPTPRAR